MPKEWPISGGNQHICKPLLSDYSVHSMYMYMYMQSVWNGMPELVCQRH